MLAHISGNLTGMDQYDDESQRPVSPISPVKSTEKRVAVALKAPPKNRAADKAHVVASGRGHIAADIIALAHAKGIKVREDADLAQLLVQLDLDTPIPSEAIIAVAEILNKVYEANAVLPIPLPLFKEHLND